jgi:hypothetical protein
MFEQPGEPLGTLGRPRGAPSGHGSSDGDELPTDRGAQPIDPLTDERVEALHRAVEPAERHGALLAPFAMVGERDHVTHGDTVAIGSDTVWVAGTLRRRARW